MKLNRLVFMTMSFGAPALAQPRPSAELRAGAVSGGWNDPAAPVEEARFAALMARVLQLLRQP